MNLEQRAVASGLVLEEQLLFLQLPHLMSLISQIVLERNYLTNHLPKNKSPETNNQGNLNQGGDDSLQPPDNNQPDHSPPQRPDPGLPGSDTENSDNNLYDPPRPPKHTGSKLTGESQQNPPAPVPPQVPIPP